MIQTRQYRAAYPAGAFTGSLIHFLAVRSVLFQIDVLLHAEHHADQSAGSRADLALAKPVTYHKADGALPQSKNIPCQL